MTHLTRRRFGQSAAALALATTLPRSAFAQSFRQGGDLRAALTGEPDVLDPATSTIYTGAQVYEGIFSKLIDLDADGNFIPDLATAWTQDDPTTWTFTLAEGVSFHNGEAFTSADVKYSFERILDPATASGYAGLYAQIDSIETPDAKTVTFRLKSPFGPFLTNLATNGQIVNRAAIESGDPARNPVGTGPFTFVEWMQGDHITLQKNPSYFKPGLPHLDSVTFRFLLVDQSRIDGLAAGELDWVDAIPLHQVPILKDDPRFTYVSSPVAGIPDFLALNTAVAPFDNVKVRQAVALAISRAAHILRHTADAPRVSDEQQRRAVGRTLGVVERFPGCQRRLLDEASAIDRAPRSFGVGGVSECISAKRDPACPGEPNGDPGGDPPTRHVSTDIPRSQTSS